ncbi:hypothetical protein LTR12_001809 [Friedmanniomyces endolithicus]|nr:hypothetical protein LTR12_001809 [Friedmanniomyces endolithicus]
MATAHVLELPELLEMILLQLPTRDLLFAQAVCKPWRHAITSSIRTRRALFLEPGAASDVHRDVATPTLQQFTSTIAFGNDKDRIIPVGDVAVNPLLFELEIFERRHSNRPQDSSENFMFTGYWMTEAALGAISQSRDASCLSMYLTQSPVALCAWVTYTLDPTGCFHRSGSTSRMGFEQFPIGRDDPARRLATMVESMAWDIVDEAAENGTMGVELDWTDVDIRAVGFSRLTGSRQKSSRRRH